MFDYWIKNRLVFSLIMSFGLIGITSLLFAYPYLKNNADIYNKKSVYCNSSMTFIAPEPSFDQVNSLSGTNGISEIFPFFLTKTDVKIKTSSRYTTVLLSDYFKNIDITMYNDSRLIKKSNKKYSNPILIDWEFSKDTGATIDDVVVINIGGKDIKYTVQAIYETNTIYEGGAVVAEINKTEKNNIINNSVNSGYSAMYIEVNNYEKCKNYLTTDYRPLGRLKDRNQFENNDKYKIHKNAILDGAYANEITDFKTKNIPLKNNIFLLLLGALITLIIIIGFNIVMFFRGTERGYFIRYCIPNGKKVDSYYRLSFIFESVVIIVGYIILVLIQIKVKKTYIPKMMINIKLMIIPLAVVVGELLSIIHKNTYISSFIKNYKNDLDNS